MLGNNELKINQATMLKILNYYFEKQLFNTENDIPQAYAIEYDTRDYNYVVKLQEKK